MEDAESVRAVCSATPTTLDCTGDLVAGERFLLLYRHPLYILRHMTSPPRWRVLASLEVVNWQLKLVAISLSEVCDLPVMVMPSFSAICLDLPSIPLIALHSLVLSVLWSMLSTNSLHWSHHSLSTAGARRDPASVCRQMIASRIGCSGVPEWMVSIEVS